MNRKRRYKIYFEETHSNVTYIVFIIIILFVLFLTPYLSPKKGVNSNQSPSESIANNEITSIDTKITSSFNYELLSNNLNLNAESAILYDNTSNKILFEKNPKSKVNPASMTKIVSAYIAVNSVPLETVFRVGEEISFVKPESSLAFLNQNSSISLHDLLYALLLPSGNDAAYTLAVNTARYITKNNNLSTTESINHFTKLMNDFAYSCEAMDTSFSNPDGFDDNYTTAEDYIKMTKCILSNSTIKTICSSTEKEVTISSGQGYYWINNNNLINKSSSFFYPYATGLKTGYTENAGYCMVATAQANEKEYIAVVFNSKSVEDRYKDAVNLFSLVIPPIETSTESTQN